MREDEVAAASMGVPLVQDEADGLRDRRRARRHRRRVPGLLPQHGQRGPVPVLVLDPRCWRWSSSAASGSIWGVVLGAIAAVLSSTRLHARRSSTTCPDKFGLELRRSPTSSSAIYGSPARDHDGPASAGPAPGAKAQDGARRGHRRRATRRCYEAPHARSRRPRRPRRTRRAGATAAILDASRHLQGVRRPGRGQRRHLLDPASARSSRSSAPTAPARRRSSTCSPASTSPTPARIALRRPRHHRRAPGPDHHAGIARTFQNIRLFATMTALENVMVGRAHADATGAALLRLDLPTTPLPSPATRGGRGPREGARDARLRRPQARARTTSWRSTSPTATSAGSRSRGRWRSDPQAAAARRADGRHEPAGVGGS